MVGIKLITKRQKDLRLLELVALALGSMVGGGILAVLGLGIETIGKAIPLAICLSALFAVFTAYPYIKLTLYYKNEGGPYYFFKKTFSKSRFAPALIGWLQVFCYISTLALFAFMFASYLGNILPFENEYLAKITVAALLITFFTIINILSVKGIGKIEDVLVIIKILLFFVLAGLLLGKGDLTNLSPLITAKDSTLPIFMIASLGVVTYAGFELLINAYKEVDQPEKNIPRAIYISIFIAALLYIALSIGTVSTIPQGLISEHQEYALASGNSAILGNFGFTLVMIVALLATSSALGSTMFGASRLMAVIAKDGYFPKKLAVKRAKHIPYLAILLMSLLAFLLILTNSLRLILEFGTITFLLVSFLMAMANFKIRQKTKTPTLVALFCLFITALISGFLLYFEFTNSVEQLIYIFWIFLGLIIGAYLFSRKK